MVTQFTAYMLGCSKSSNVHCLYVRNFKSYQGQNRYGKGTKEKKLDKTSEYTQLCLLFVYTFSTATCLYLHVRPPTIGLGHKENCVQ